MQEKQWLSNYFKQYQKSIFNEAVNTQLGELAKMILETNKAGRKVVFAGNGGSAAIASHGAVDFTKTAGIRAINFNESDLITCLANDYGYENWVQKAIEFYADKGDLIILISSSGKSPNMVNAGKYAKEEGFNLVTFTGFSESNPLKKSGKLNLWVNSEAYNIVENTHLVWILGVCDLIIENGKSKGNKKAAYALGG